MRSEKEPDGVAEMGQSMRKTMPKSNHQALAAFVAKKGEIDTMLERVRSLSDDHFDAAPEEVTWGHVGSLEHCAELLKRITDMACNEGEHAA